MTRYSEEAWASAYTPELIDAVLRMVCATLPARAGGSEPGEPFDHATGDDWLGDVGPAMSFEDREEYEEHKRGTSATGLTVRAVHEYYTTSDPNRRDSRGRETRIEGYGWGKGVEFRATVSVSVYIRWVLPRDDHAALLAAWTEFKAARGLTVTWPGKPTRA